MSREQELIIRKTLHSEWSKNLGSSVGLEHRNVICDQNFKFESWSTGKFQLTLGIAKKWFKRKKERAVTMPSEVVEREQNFHDKRFTDDSFRKNKVGRFYKIVDSIRREYQEKVQHFAAQGQVLEFGCGKGGAAFFLAERAIKITAIDISMVAIEAASRQALNCGLSNVRFFQMNAEQLDFDEKFDLICGSGILHHLHLTKALHEIKRVLRTGGHAVFVEPLGHNPFINLYRRLTPKIRSQDEHPLLAKDLETIKTLFPEVEVRYYYLTSLLAAFFSGTVIFKPLLSMLETVDKTLLKLPWVRNWAWQVLLVMRA